PDKDDKCPMEPEAKNGYQDEDGCPDVAPATQPKKPVARLSSVSFASGSAKVDEKSEFVLDAAVRILKQNPTMKLEIDGHTGDIGSRAASLRLSQERANAVKAYLVSKGIEGGRLRAVGLAGDAPIDSGTSAESRARNRRVDFKIE